MAQMTGTDEVLIPQMTRQARCVLPLAADGRFILDVLAERFTYHTREDWQTAIANGRVLLNDKVVEQFTVCRQNDILEYRPERLEEPEVDKNVRVLARHSVRKASGESLGDVIFLDKPGNLPCHPAGRFFNHTLWAMLKCGGVHGIPAGADVHFVNRLDRETSGIVTVAMNSQVARIVTRCLVQPSSFKEYRVLVEGNVAEERFTAEGYLWNSPESSIRKKRQFGASVPAGAERIETVRTQFERLATGGGISLLKAVLDTGRMHQIRATLCSLGYPVVGDKLYGVDETMYLRFIHGMMTDTDWRLLRLPLQALHAHRVVLPLNGEMVEIVSDVPDSWSEILKSMNLK